MELENTGTILRRLRGKRTLEDVANAVGVTKSAMSAYERGARNPRDEVKVAIAKFYNKSVQYIFFK